MTVSFREILMKNGTAVDIAIAVLVCNGAVHSHALGLGGGFFMTVYIKAERQSYFLNARGMAPLAASKDMYNDIPKGSTQGPISIAVPGEIKGYFEAKSRFGNPSLTMLDLFEPTIILCKEGFQITHSLKEAIDTFDRKPDKFDTLLR